MSEPLPTASGLERALECPGSEVLTRVHSTREEASRGNSLHRFARLVLRGVSREDALVHVAPKWQATAKSIDWRALTRGLADIRSEQAFAIDVETQEARFLGEDIGRRYPARAATEFAGTEDYSGVLPDGMPVTRDIKTGWKEVTPAAENPQVKFFAARRFLEGDVDQVEGGIAYIREDGRVHLDSHVFTRIEVEDFLDDLAELVPRIDAARAQYAATGTVTTSSGPWCRYCPGLSACPSKVGLARSAMGTLSDIGGRIVTMTPEEKGEAWVRAKEIEQLVEVVLDGLKACAKQAAFPTRGGAKEVRVVEMRRSVIVAERAVALMRELGATSAQIDGVYNDTLVEQVRELNAPRAPKGRRVKAA